MQQNLFTLPWFGMPPPAEPEAATQVARLASLGVLSLRDPLHPHDEARARPCNFSEAGPIARLACAGHLSWRWRSTPRLASRRASWRCF